MKFLLLTTVLITSILSSPTSTKMNTTKFYLIPRRALRKPSLTKNMINLLDSKRDKRQFYLYQQNPVEANIAITPVGNYPVDPVVDTQYANSPQFILVQSKDLIPFQSELGGTVEQVTENYIPSVTQRAELNNLISLAAQSAMRTQKGLEVGAEFVNSFTATTESFFPTSNLIQNIAAVNPEPVEVGARSVNTLFGVCNNNKGNEGGGGGPGNDTVTSGSVNAVSSCGGSGGSGSSASSAAASSSGGGKGGCVVPMPSQTQLEGGINLGISDALKTIHEEIKKVKAGKFHGRKEGLPCSLAGQWQSEAAGVTFVISKEDVHESCIAVEPGRTKGFFESTTWDVYAQMPFKKISLIHMIAIHQESLHMATFTGECRVCQGKEFVSGHWLVVKNESTCWDMNKGQDFFGDLWERKISANESCLK